MIFHTLYKRAAEDWYFPSWQNNKQAYICWLLLQVFYRARYHQEIRIERLQSLVESLQKENKRYLHKLDSVLRINAGCIGVPLKTTEPPPEDNPYVELDDATFLALQKEYIK